MQTATEPLAGRWTWRPIEAGEELAEVGDAPELAERRVAGALLGSLRRAGSREVYRRDLNAFVAWWLENGPGDQPRPLAAERAELDRYANYLADPTVSQSPASQARALAVASAFYEMACELELRSHNPMKRVRRPKIENEDARTGLDRGEALQLLEAAERWSDEAEGTLVMLLLLYGLRVSEAVAIRASDLVSDGGKLKVRLRRKGKDSLVSMTIDDPATALRLERLAQRGAGPAEPLFGGADRFRARSVVATVGRAAGLSRPIHPHILRHTFCAQQLRAGQSLEEVRRLAGHASIRTTQRYLHAIEAEDAEVGTRLRAELSKAAP